MAVLGRYLLGPATEAEPHVRGRDQLFWLDRLAQEHDNLHASLRAAIDAGDAATACALVARLGWYWWLRGHRMEGAALASEVSLIKPLVGIFEQPDAEAGFRAVEPLFDDPDPWLRATSRMILAHLRLNFGQSSEAASADMREALAGFRAIGERWGIGFSLSALGDMAAAEGDFAQAVRSQYEALALVREVGIRENIPQLEVKLAHQLWMAGELAEARRMLKQSRQSAEEIGLPEVIASVRHGFATFARLEGNLVEARAAATVAATQLEKPTFAPQFRATTRGTLGLIEASAGNLVAARATPYGVRETARSPTATGS